MDTLGERIKHIRIKNKFNQADFAKELGISQSHLSGVEKNNVSPSLTLLKLISLKFIVKEDWLLTNTGKPYGLGNLATDDNCKQRYKQLQLHIDNMIKDMEGETLKIAVETYSYFVSVLLYPTYLKNKEQSKEMLKTMSSMMNILDGLLMQCKIEGRPTDGITSNLLHISLINTSIIELMKYFEKTE